eukprot:m51a1_g10302 hypothetical protein (764) ;mRNA; r:62386-66383
MVAVPGVSCSGDGSAGSSAATAHGSDSCAQRKTCQSCASSGELCGWCADTGLCLNATPSAPRNCSLWLRGTCTAPPRGGGGLGLWLVVPLVGGVGGAVVVACSVAAAVLVAASLAGRLPPAGAAAPTAQEGLSSAGFVFVSHAGQSSAEAQTVFQGVTADTALGGSAGPCPASACAAGQYATESLAPLSLTTAPCVLALLGPQLGAVPGHAAAALCSVYTQYNSAGDTSVGLRVLVDDINICNDGKVYSDAQFLFRELPALDGSAGGVSLMPAANDGFFLCAEGNDTDRLVVVSPALSASLCTFRKVAGLSNPALVSLEQRGRYVGYASAYTYNCAPSFIGRTGWTVGLVERPADARLATWVAAESSAENIYVQDTNYWLCELNGVAVFNVSVGNSVQCQWDVVAALGTNDSSSSAVSLRLRNTLVYLGVSAQESPGDNDSAALQLRVHSCAGTERLCVWTAAQSEQSGDLFLTHVASGLVVTLQGTAGGPRAVLLARQRNSSLQTLGFWRAGYVKPSTPDVVVVSDVPSSSLGASSSSGALSSSSGREDQVACAARRTCQACAGAAECGWCSDTGLCLNASSPAPLNCSLWLRGTCTAAPEDGGLNLSLVVPLVAGAGGVAVVACAVAGALLVARAARKARKRPPTSAAAPAALEGAASAGFTFVSVAASRDSAEAATEFLGVSADPYVETTSASDPPSLCMDAGQCAVESLAPLSLSGPCFAMLCFRPQLGVASEVQLQGDSSDAGLGMTQEGIPSTLSAQ